MTFSFALHWLWASPSRNDETGRGASRRREKKPDHSDSRLPESSHDAEYVSRVRSGDAEAFETLFLKHHHRLWAFAYDLTGSSEIAEEIVQDVFASLWIRRERWSVLYSIAEYLFGAVRNLAYKARKRRAVFERMQSLVGETAEVPALGVMPLDPARAAEVADLNARLQGALARMPEGRRTAFLLWWRDQLTNQEIAHVMGISANAVGVQLTRARRELRFLFENSM